MKKSSFTLIELLVVVAIIGILASLILPALGSARERGRAATCKSNLKNIALSIQMYTDDNDDWVIDNNDAQNISWRVYMAQYLQGNHE